MAKTTSTTVQRLLFVVALALLVGTLAYVKE